jgi:hypothetical protein
MGFSHSLDPSRKSGPGFSFGWIRGANHHRCAFGSVTGTQPSGLQVHRQPDRLAWFRLSDRAGGIVMKGHNSTKPNVRKLSDDGIAKRYLDLQKLRDEVRKAESSLCGIRQNEDLRMVRASALKTRILEH